MGNKRRCFGQQTARINVTLPIELIESVNQIAGPRSCSRLIVDPPGVHPANQKDELEKQLEEGYRATAKESIVMAREFEGPPIWRDGMNIKRGEIYLAALDPARGRNYQTPVVIVSNDKNNEFSGTLTILPLTSKNLRTIYPFEVFLSRGMPICPKIQRSKGPDSYARQEQNDQSIGVLDKKDLDATARP